MHSQLAISHRSRSGRTPRKTLRQHGKKHLQSLKSTSSWPNPFDNASQPKDNQDEVKRILEDGKKMRRTAAVIYEALANLELRADRVDEAIKVLESGLKSSTASDQDRLRVILAELLANHGYTGKLDLQIQELRKLGYSQLFIQYFTACYYINTNEFLKASQLLQPIVNFGQFPDLQMNAKVNELLAHCHSHLGEPEMQQAALLRAHSADPQNVEANQGRIENMIGQGDLDGAIKEYRLLVKRLQGGRLKLAQLLIVQNQRRPERQRDWNEVAELIKQEAEASPESIAPVILKAELLFAQGDQAAAQAELEKARTKFPKSLGIWIAQANILQRLRGRLPRRWI